MCSPSKITTWLRSSSNSVPVVDRQPAADVDQAVLLGADPGAVGVVAELAQNLGDGALRVALLALLDEQGVLDHARGVQVDLDAVAVAQLAQRLDVGHAHRLAAGHVDRAGQADVGHVFRAHAPEQRFQLVQVDVALEGVQVRRSRAPRR